MLGEGVLAGPTEITVTTNAAPEGVVAQVHATLLSGRTLETPDGMLHLDPTHSCGSPTHLVIMASRGLAADVDYATTQIPVDFEEHVEIAVDGLVPVDVTAGEYLVLSVQIYRHVAVSEFRTQVGIEAFLRADPVPHARCVTEEHGLSSSS